MNNFKYLQQVMSSRMLFLVASLVRISFSTAIVEILSDLISASPRLKQAKNIKKTQHTFHY